MAIKKLLVAAATGIAAASTTIVIAGGAEYVPMPTYAGVYIEANAGYTTRDWEQDVSTVYGASSNISNNLTSPSNINGGFTGGGDIGYQFNEYWSIEGGWFYLPTVQGTVGNTPSTVNTGLAYGAIKGNIPVYENTYIYGKLGGGYTYNRTRNTTFPSTDQATGVSVSKYWNPVFAVGIQYYFTPNWSANFQYFYDPGYHNSSSTNYFAPLANMFTAGVGYKFLV